MVVAARMHFLEILNQLIAAPQRFNQLRDYLRKRRGNARRYASILR
jgi:hypothetical protein